MAQRLLNCGQRWQEWQLRSVSENGDVFVVLILVILDSEGGAKWCSNVL